MNYKIVNGNLLDATEAMICHQVNCQGAMNSGVAKGIRNKYPEVFNQYLQAVSNHRKSGEPLLGCCQYVDISSGNGRQFCCNMFAQNRYGYDGRTYTSLEAFRECLEDINRVCVGCSVAFPWKVGCVRGGADWDTVLPMICEVLKDVSSLTFYKLDLG